MKIKYFEYLGNTYSYDVEKPDYYFYDNQYKVHCIHYLAFDYAGIAYKTEWRIPGNQEGKLEDGKKYAKRLSELLDPWDMINLSNEHEVSDKEKLCHRSSC
jgi:hypothetical protein